MDRSQLAFLRFMVADVGSGDPVLQLVATSQIRKLLSIDDPPIEEVVRSDVVPRFVKFLEMEDDPQLQYEAAWALTNIASGMSEYTKKVIEHGAVPNFVKLLSSPYDHVREQAVWALGNIAGDSPESRSTVLGSGAFIPLLSQLNESATVNMLRTATWALGNFCNEPQLPLEQVRSALKDLGRLINSYDNKVTSNACWAISFIADGTHDKIQAVIDAEVCPGVINLLCHPSASLMIPTLCTVANIVTGDDTQTQEIINCEALPCLHHLLTEKDVKSIIKRDVCRTISNITAGNRDQIQAVIDAGLISPLVQLISSADVILREQAARAVLNVTCCGSDDQIKFLVNKGCIKPLCNLLIRPKIIKSATVAACLVGLDNILKVREAGMSGVNLYAQAIDKAVGLEKIDELKTDPKRRRHYESLTRRIGRRPMTGDEAMPQAD